MTSDPSPDGRAPAWQHALAALGYLVLTFFYMRPAWRVFGTHLAPDPGDPLFLVVILKWGMRQMRLGMPDFWDAPFFFPSRGVTTFSEHLLGPAAFGTLMTSLGAGPITVFNTLFVGSFVLCGWSVWYVLRRSGAGGAAAFLGGCMFAFAPFRWDHLSHMQLLLMHWIPLTLWSWDRLLAAPDWKRAVLFVAFYALHVTGGTYLAYMIHVPMLILLLYRAPALWRQGRLRPALAVLIPTGVAAGLVLMAVFLPYLQRAGKNTRWPAEILGYGASLASYVTPSPSSFYVGDRWVPWGRPENALFSGAVLTLLALLAAREGWRRHRSPPARSLSSMQKAALAVLSALALVLFALGELRTWEMAGSVDAPDVPQLGGHRSGMAFLILGLAALLLWRLWRGNWPLRFAELEPWDRGLVVSGIACFFLTFPLVYLPLMRLVPGLAGMRVPARFYALLLFPLVWFAARELDRRLRRIESPRRRKLAAAALAALLFVELAPKPLNWEPLPEGEAVPAVYRWLAGRNDVSAVLEVPMKDNSTDILYMYFATFHWKPLVNGYSGYIPGRYAELQAACCWPVPRPDQLERLRRWGVSHLLIHREAVRQRWERRLLRQWTSQPGIRLEYFDGRDRVFRIQPPEPR